MTPCFSCEEITVKFGGKSKKKLIDFLILIKAHRYKFVMLFTKKKIRKRR